MRADAVCKRCAAPVRRAIRQVDRKMVLLESHAKVDADIGIVGWESTPEPQWRVPVVSIVTPAARTETPMRYAIHDCGS